MLSALPAASAPGERVSMRIHIYSRSFAPSVGGMEMLMEILAREFQRQGHVVEVVTETPGLAEFPFPVHRLPGFWHYVRLARSGEVILTAPLSLRRLLPQLLARRRIIVTHPLLFADKGRHRFAAALKRITVHFLTNIVPSYFMAARFPRPVVIENPYDAETFSWPDTPANRRNILFVGRLVQEKGCHILLHAYARISSTPNSARLTIVGDGPERPALIRLASALGISDRVTFLGAVSGPPLARTMQAHGIMVVPTVCEEAFGIVALEGLASGCRMIVARSGGLPEAIGPMGLIYPLDDAEALAACLEQALAPGEAGPDRQEVETWLEAFAPARIASRYLAVLGTS